MRTVGKALMLILALVLVASPAMAAKIIKLHHLNQDDPFDNPTGAMATVFKSLVEAGTNGGIFKSTDGGTTWKQLSRGLPSEGIVQADIAVAPSDGAELSGPLKKLMLCGRLLLFM